MMSLNTPTPNSIPREEKWKDTEIYHLRVFVAVATSGSFSKAAQFLGLTQPRISQQIQNLESFLEVKLLNRSQRRVSLTPAGRYFMGQAQDLLRQIHNTCRTTANLGGTPGAHLRVGVVPICNATFMPIIIGKFLALHPDCRLTIEEVSATDIESRVESGQFDLGIGFLPHASPKLRYQRLIREKFILVTPKNHPLASEKQVPISSLETHDLILLPPTYFMRHLIDDIFRQNQILPRVQVEMTSATAIIRTVGESGLSTLLPPFSVNFHHHPELCGVELIGKQPSIELGLIHPPKKAEGLHLKLIDSFCQISLKALHSPLKRISSPPAG